MAEVTDDSGGCAGCAAVAAGTFIGATAGFVASFFVVQWLDPVLGLPGLSSIFGILIGAVFGAFVTAHYYDKNTKQPGQ
jgi:uncharacterized membrane protein YccC